MGINETIQETKMDLAVAKNRARPANTPYIDKATECLDHFLALDSSDPDVLMQRLTWLRNAKQKIDGGMRILGGRIPKPRTQTGRRWESDDEILRYCVRQWEGVLDRLTTINQFYGKHSSRIDHKAIKESGFFKTDEYYLSKGISDEFFHQKTERHLRKEFGQDFFTDYSIWLGQQGNRYADRNAAYTATRFLLEQDEVKRWRKIGKNRRLVGGAPVNQLRFVNGEVLAAYTESGAYAYPGGGQGRVWNVHRLHTLGDPIQIGQGQGAPRFTFMSRTNVLDQELPLSLKYAMRHDELFIVQRPRQEHMHARTVDFKSVQAAGGIVARLGKVIAIDNLSGHYKPGWGLLYQAVQKINSEQAFHPNAYVGLLSAKARPPETWYFPVQVFLQLAGAGFTADAINNAHQALLPVPVPVGDTEVTDRINAGLWTQKMASVDDFAKNLKRI